jgi:hypothetical protein
MTPPEPAIDAGPASAAGTGPAGKNGALLSRFVEPLLLDRRVTGARRAVRGMSALAAGPMLVRGAILAAGLVALGLAAPAALLTTRWAALLLVIVVLPVVMPRGRFVTLFEFATVFGWLASTTAYGEPVTVWRLVAVAGAMYLVHTSAALAAVLPVDAVVSGRVLAGALARAGIVVALTALFCLAVVVGVPLLGDRAYLAAAVGGLAVTAGLGWLLALLARRDRM